MNRLRSANLALALLLEVALLGVYCDGGFHLQGSNSVRILVGIGAPVLVALVWSALLAPRAQHRLSQAWLLLLKVVLFGGAVLVLALVGQTGPAMVFGMLATLNLCLAVLWRQA